MAVDDFNSGGGGSSPPGWDATSSSFGGPSDAGGFGGDTGGFGGGGAGGFGGGGGEPVRRGGTIVMGDGNADPTPFGGGAAPVTGGAARQPTPGGGRGGTVVMDGGFDSDPQQGSGYGQQGSPRPSSGSGSKLVGLLYSFSGDVNGAVWPVRFGRAVLGSSDNCAVRLAFNGVSRNHCQVISRPSPGGQGNIVRIMDLGSVNGTIVNGLDIQGQHALEHGDKIRVGPMELVYVSVPPPGI